MPTIWRVMELPRPSSIRARGGKVAEMAIPMTATSPPLPPVGMRDRAASEGTIDSCHSLFMRSPPFGVSQITE
jgi:hypothetical protein